MHRFMRLSALLLAVSADENCLEEESSLIQEAAPVKTTKRDVKPLAGLLESARGFLVNGATNDVLTFANETLQAIRDQILPALIDEAEADNQWLINEHARFADVLTTLRTHNQQVNQLNTEERTASSNHVNCRYEEHTACHNKRNCEMTLYGYWESWVTDEEELKEVHLQINDHFCPIDANGNFIANGTQHTFRVGSVPLMQAYLEKKQDAETAETNYDNQVPLCDVTNRLLDEKSSECNGILYSGTGNLESKACSLVTKIYTTQSDFHSSWSALHASYQGVSDLVYNQTDDRFREYRTLKIVECLLGRTAERNGRPCDESTNEADTEMTECETVGATLNICTEEPNLCPNYPAPPSTPDDCETRATVHLDTGAGLECIPVPVPWCEDNQWNGLEMQPIKDNSSYSWPTEVYTATNPGCNAIQGCSDIADYEACPGVPVTIITGYHTWVLPPASFQLTSWQVHPDHLDETAEAYSSHYMLGDVGATVDGCHAGDPNIVEHRDQWHQAAVRCCYGADGASCLGQINGVCYADATYAQAKDICETAGMHLCSHEEMCGTSEAGGVCYDSGCNFPDGTSWWVLRDEMTFGHWSNYDNPGEFQQGRHPGVTTAAPPTTAAPLQD